MITDNANCKILLVAPTPSHPPIAGNRQRILRFLETLESLGFDFRFVWLAQENGDVTRMRERWGERFTYISDVDRRRPQTLWHRGTNKVLRLVRIRSPYSTVVDASQSKDLCDTILEEASRFHPNCVIVMYVFWSWILDAFPNHVRKLIDTNDIMGARHVRFLKAGAQPEWLSTTTRQERKALERADCVIAIQEREADYFRRLTAKPVITIGHLLEPNALPQPAPYPPLLLFCGSDNGVNRDAVEWLLNEIWPIIRKEVPSATLNIAGRICDHVNGTHVGVTLVGVISDMREAYRRVHIVISPLRFGTGLKIKNIEAMSFGRALVTTPVGAEGFEEYAGQAFEMAERADDLAARCLHLITHERERDRLANEAIRFASKEFEKNKFALRRAIATHSDDGI